MKFEVMFATVWKDQVIEVDHVKIKEGHRQDKESWIREQARTGWVVTSEDSFKKLHTHMTLYRLISN